MIEELIEPAPVNVERLKARQDAERQARNCDNLEAWHVLEFGPIVGPQLARGHAVMLAAAGFNSNKGNT